MANFFKNLGIGARDSDPADAQRTSRPPAPRSRSQPSTQDADVRRQGLVWYARAAFFLERYLKAIDAGEPPPIGTAVRAIQTFVDLSEAQLAVLLSLTTVHGDEDYLAFHHVNAALMSIALARELGFTRPQMRDVGLSALFHETGIARLPAGLLDGPGALSAEARAALDTIPGESMQQVLHEKSASQACLRRIALSEELRWSHVLAERDEKGVLIGLAPAKPRSAYAEVISICCVYDALRSKRPYRSAFRPEAAILLMWSELRERFDPELLRVFMRVMHIAPLKLQGKMAEAIQLSDPEFA